MTETNRVQIDWSEPHDIEDAESQIRSLIAAGGDEGPLLVVPLPSGRRAAQMKPQIFKDVDAYLGHLASITDFDSYPTRERMVALVRGSFRTNGKLGLAALWNLKQLLSPTPASSAIRRPQSRRIRWQPSQLFVEEGPFTTDQAYQVRHGGDAWSFAHQQFPQLKDLAEEEDWEVDE